MERIHEFESKNKGDENRKKRLNQKSAELLVCMAPQSFNNPLKPRFTEFCHAICFNVLLQYLDTC